MSYFFLTITIPDNDVNFVANLVYVLTAIEVRFVDSIPVLCDRQAIEWLQIFRLGTEIITQTYCLLFALSVY